MDQLTRTRIPTPFSVGSVNCYQLTGNGVTVVDPGPATDEAYEVVADSLATDGYEIAEIDRILITHPHMDHFGQASRLVEASGADVVAHEHAVDRLADPIAHFKREQAYFRPFLRSMGMPTDAVDTVLELPEPYTEYQAPVTVTDPVADGDTVDAGVTLECVSTPGHVPGSVSFLAAAEDAMFTGDHVLPDITPNPLLTVAPDATDERTRSLPAYIEALETVLELEATVGYGGHGEPMSDLHGRVRETIDHHEERKEHVAELVADAEPVTAYAIMKEMFPELPATEMFSGMSEVIGHLDLLADEDRVRITERDGVDHYELLEPTDG
ncbi:MBL fold metallo-hydrolase [Salinadaptatus halalkaliphilus]|uniref:MBL fold metallo-hydrolase n=1 Tax=Salinadaptatus halalkaliphilus TaxID=2419781 RepID=A0A4S3TR02_9EURY|nr:MBL fold metallo-hydrolase [Salinadaptatus halalkaliphilus]THE66834.1 MBL fold metallo-hydrolase [Salinadaptatus halalkaliphilus]